MIRRGAMLLAGLMTAWLAATVVGAQGQAPQTTFRTAVDLVQVDVVVVDPDGRPVRGLTARDFAIRDRKQLQNIVTFDEIAHDAAPDAPAAPALPPSLALDVASNRSAQSDRLVVMVVDDLHIYQGRTAKAKELARQIVSQLGGQASMAVLFTSGAHSTQVTEDRSILFAALDTFKGRQSWRRPHEAVDSQMPGHIDPESSAEVVLKQLEGAQKHTLQDFFDNITAIKTLQDAARLIGAGDARRKAFVVLSEGIEKEMTGMFDGPMTPCETAGGACYHDAALRQMMESLRRSNVATYDIDPRGHVSSRELALENFPAPSGLLQGADTTALDDDSVFDWDNPVRKAQRSLKIMAEASGGFAVTNTDDFTSGLQRIVEDIDHYYLIGFNPSDTSGKGFRPLDVTVINHPDWVVHARKGYMAGGPPAPPANADPLVALSAGVMPKTDLPLRMTAIALPARADAAKPATGGRPGAGAGHDARVAIALEVTTPRRDITDASGALDDSLRYSVLAARVKDGTVVKQFTNTAHLTSKNRPTLTTGDAIAIQFPIELMLPPGRYQLRASAISAGLAKGGSVYLVMDVPDFGAAPLAISGLALGYSDGARVPAGRIAGSDSTTPRTPPFDVALDREFTTLDKLRLYFEVAQPRPGTPVQTKIEFVDATDKAVMSVDRPIGAGEPNRIDVELRLNDLEPGVYRVRVTATAASDSAQREIGVVVR